MKKVPLLLILLLSIGCASSKADRTPSTIILARAGGFSGLEERFMIEENGHAKKTMRFPGEEEKTTADTMLSPATVASMFSCLDRNIGSLSKLTMNETGNMTTTLILTHNNQTHMLRWPNLEPPVTATKQLDTLYSLVEPVQRWLSPTN